MQRCLSRPTQRPGTRPSFGLVMLVFLAFARMAAAAEPLIVNPFNDPFAQATHGLVGCPAPSPPTYTRAEIREVEHHRVERGNSCYLAGKCRYASSFDYDRGIAAALLPAVRADPALRDSAVWVLVQGRVVLLSGCVSQSDQIERLEAIARATPDVQVVLSDLLVGTRGHPPYRLALPASQPP